ncbi:MAG: hypothetical protein A3D31_08430 [Candidatus Fluviicola riflensis]|nr:MAG: hypothetical protein CHH17_06570 [Candidatus Fluviicola riflensis]OGS79966.1 MAG: hypothetical protein A3D31_08430 [Candidatus Fluviicola riflensis]OGS82481.1 MAG: hypothetical protein A2724_17375 [Fluviicola sp. RIFCSPHIGHO2_01_FULL_43_53]OGS88145.1 MAG: hypothetical protein A3E30_14810 [Fluviicola sp. RIFCSPHIGHO2_12_FULL_43_24]
MLVNTTYVIQVKTTLVRVLKRGLTLKVIPMESFSKHRIELAKEKLREKLSFQYVSNLPAYRNITKAQYEKLIANIEAISLALLETIANSNNLNHG